MAPARPVPAEAELRGKNPAELEAAIAATRARIGTDLDALAYQLSPERFRERARASLEDVQEVIMSTVEEVAQAVAERSKEASSSFFDLAKSNPLPAALIGLGVGLLAAGGATAARARSHHDAHADGGRWQAGSGAAGGGSAASYGEAYYGQAYEYRPAHEEASGRERRGLARWVEEQPLAAGLLGVILGAAIGLGVPGTRYENEVLGPRRDAALDRASEAAKHAADAFKESVRELRQNAQTQLEQRGLTPEGLKARAAEAGRELRDEVEAAAREVAGGAKDARRSAEGGEESGQG